jgi:putative transposase
MGLGYVGGDYVRHGTTTLFAALDVAMGAVSLNASRATVIRSISPFCDACIPKDLDVHLIVDNYATHKHPKIRTWLAQGHRFHIHYTNVFFLAESS